MGTPKRPLSIFEYLLLLIFEFKYNDAQSPLKSVTRSPEYETFVFDDKYHQNDSQHNQQDEQVSACLHLQRLPASQLLLDWVRHIYTIDFYHRITYDFLLLVQNLFKFLTQHKDSPLTSL